MAAPPMTVLAAHSAHHTRLAQGLASPILEIISGGCKDGGSRDGWWLHVCRLPARWRSRNLKFRKRVQARGNRSVRSPLCPLSDQRTYAVIEGDLFMFACARDTMLVNFISKRMLEIFTTDKTTNLTSFLFYKLCAFVSSNCIL